MDWQKEFPLDNGLIHLNHAAVAPWPERTRAAVAAFAEENTRQGSKGYLRWYQIEQDLRARLARLINAQSAADIALLKSTSEALSFIAYGLDWQAGDNIVGLAGEFPSNRIVWESLASRGVELRLADADSEDPEAAMLALVDDKTRLLTVSAVQFATGLRMDLPRLGRFCRENEVLFCVDAIQQIGALPFDVEEIQADFVAADGHKWMLGPEGLALFWVRPELRDRLSLQEYGWHMVEAMGDYDRQDWQIATDARRFECGSPNTLGTIALEASLSLLEEVGMEQVRQAIWQRVDCLLDRINAHPQLEVLSAQNSERRSAIVTFRHLEISSEILYKQLQEKEILCAMRGGGIRFSPHFYTPMENLDAALEAIL